MIPQMIGILPHNGSLSYDKEVKILENTPNDLKFLHVNSKDRRRLQMKFGKMLTIFERFTEL